MRGRKETGMGLRKGTMRAGGGVDDDIREINRSGMDGKEKGKVSRGKMWVGERRERVSRRAEELSFPLPSTTHYSLFLLPSPPIG